MFAHKALLTVLSITGLFLTSCQTNSRNSDHSKNPIPVSIVLTGNPGPDEAGINLNCTYTVTPDFKNSEGDPENLRLIDSDIPHAKVKSTVGASRQDFDIVFDLKFDCRIYEVAIFFGSKPRPAQVDIFTGDKADGPWKLSDGIWEKDLTEGYWKVKLSSGTGRYLKIFFKRSKSELGLREVKIYGNVMVPDAKAAKIVGNRPLLIADGVSHATIVVPDDLSPRTLDAATAFQNIARRMTGVWIPIKRESEFDDKSTPVYIGDSAAVRKLGIEVKQNAAEGDHYVIKSGPDYIGLVGNDAKECFGKPYLRGSVYAVYDFFERLGCGWFGPDPLWQIFPNVKTIVVPEINADERPAYLWRLAWLHKVNSREMRDAWREGGFFRGGGHAYDKLVPPEKYKKEHPEWFGKKQPDVTNPEVIKIVIEDCRQKIDEVPAPIIRVFSFVPNDCGGYAENKRTKKIGNISAQQLYFANEVAKELNKTHPGRFRIFCLGYWHSHEPPEPMMKAEPGVVITIVNEGNHTKPLDMPESEEIAKTTSRNNTREIKDMTEWMKTGGLDGIYEWYIPGIGNKIWIDMPWYPGELTMRNLRFWYSKGIRNIFYESQREQFPLRWPVYYQCYKGMWNPNLTAKEIMTNACGKLFGPAAGPMMNYYTVFENAMLNTKEHIGNWHLPSPDKVYTPEVEKEADHWLEEAEKKAADENAAKRIAEEKRLWLKAKSLLAELRNAKTTSVFDVVLDEKKMTWQKQFITKNSLISLFGLPENTAIEIIEKDGQNRTMQENEKVDLALGIVFKTLK